MVKLKYNKQQYSVLPAILIASIGSLVSTQVMAMGADVDSFTDLQVVSNPANGTETVGSTATGLANVIGGQRDVSVSVVTGGLDRDDNDSCDNGDSCATVNVSADTLKFLNSTGVAAVAKIQWDGDDQSIALVPDGIGVDFTANGESAFVFTVKDSDLSFQFKLGVYSNANEFTVVEIQSSEVLASAPLTRIIPFSVLENAAFCGNPGLTGDPQILSVTCGSGNTSPVKFSDFGAMEIQLNTGDIPTRSIDLIVGTISTLLNKIQIEKSTNGNDADGANDGTVPVIAPSDTVTWEYVVTNTGDIPIDRADIVVTDDQPGVIPVYVVPAPEGVLPADNGDDVLEPGEKWIYTADLPAENLTTTTSGVTIVEGCDPDQSGFSRPTYENIGTVTAGVLEDTDPSHYCNPPEPGIDIEKFTNGFDADGKNDSDVPDIKAGDPVEWTYIVTNTGDVAFALGDVLVTDNITGVTPVFDPLSDDGDSILAPAEQWLYKASDTAENLLTNNAAITIVDGCDPENTGLTRKTYENIGTVIIFDTSLIDFDPSHYCNSPEPGIDIEKLTNDKQADNADDAEVPVIVPGGTVTWTYIVTNTGNVPYAFADVIVTDDQGVIPVPVLANGDADGILSPGEIWNYTATLLAENLMTTTSGVTIVDGCNSDPLADPRPTYENIGKVVAGTEEDTDPSHYCNPVPGIDIEKLTNGHDADGANDNDVPVIVIGADVTWTYVVTNTGGISFAKADVVVTDDQSVNTLVNPIFVANAGTDDGDEFLAPGEIWHYTDTLAAEDLVNTTSGVTIVDGCSSSPDFTTRATYENVGTVTVNGLIDTDPSHYCNPPEDIEFLGCRVTAGGVNAEFTNGDGEVNRYQFGGQAGAHTGKQPQPSGEWTHHQQNGPAGDFTFHGGTASAPEGSEIDVIRCSDPGGCGPSGNPPSPLKQIDFDGIGTFKNLGKATGKKTDKIPDFVTADATATAEGHGNTDFAGTFHWFEVNIDDLGEVGNTNKKKNPAQDDPEVCPLDGFGEKGSQALADCDCPDFYRITIYDGVYAADITKNADGSIPKIQMNTTDVIYEVWGYIDGGNLQIHSPTGFDTK